jgi:hypothetical protein
MALILKRPGSDVIILKQSVASRFVGLVWLGAGGMIMFAFKGSGMIWAALPCLLIGIHCLTHVIRIQASRSGRNVIWKRRLLLLPAQEQTVPFAGIRSVRVEVREALFQTYGLYFLLVDGSKLSVNRALSADLIMVQANELARFVGRPLVYEQARPDTVQEQQEQDDATQQETGRCQPPETTTPGGWKSVIKEGNHGNRSHGVREPRAKESRKGTENPKGDK